MSIRFQVAGRTVNDIERAIAEEFQAAGIPSNAYYRWDADGRCHDVTTGNGPRIINGGYTVDVVVEYEAERVIEKLDQK